MYVNNKGVCTFCSTLIICCCLQIFTNALTFNSASYPWEVPSSMTFNHYVMEMYPYKPKPRNLDTKKLLQRMKSDFDPKWMSITQPQEQIANRKTVEYYSHQNELLHEISRINFTYANNRGGYSELKDINRKAVEKWLLQMSSCHVYFSWKDLGIVFWPRWLKQGYCNTEHTCSWPPGMHCVPAEDDPVRILNWQCHTRSKRKKKRTEPEMVADMGESNANMTWYQPQKGSILSIPPLKETNTIKRLKNKKNKKRRQKMRCKWTKVKYPLVTSCYCSC